MVVGTPHRFQPTQGNYATVGSAIVAIAIVSLGGMSISLCRQEWQGE